jgi:thioredoxin 2
MPTVVTCPSCGRRNRVPDAASGRPRCAHCHSDLPWLVDVGDDRFADAVENSPLPVLVDIWAPWCGPCRMVSPVVEQIGRERAGTLKVAKVNSDTSPAVSARHRVTSIPTLLLYAGGREVARTIGARPAAELRRWVDESLASP